MTNIFAPIFQKNAYFDYFNLYYKFILFASINFAFILTQMFGIF